VKFSIYSFNPELTILLNIYEMCSCEISVYNIKGQLIKNLFCDDLAAGERKLVWQGDNDNGRKVSSGVYFCKIKIGEYEEMKKVILMK